VQEKEVEMEDPSSDEDCDDPLRPVQTRCVPLVLPSHEAEESDAAYHSRILRRDGKPHANYAHARFVEPVVKKHFTREQRDLIENIGNYLQHKDLVSQPNKASVLSVLGRLILGEGIQYSNIDTEVQKVNKQPMRFMEGTPLVLTGKNAVDSSIKHRIKEWLGPADHVLHGWGSTHPIQKFIDYQQYANHLSRPKPPASPDSSDDESMQTEEVDMQAPPAKKTPVIDERNPEMITNGVYKSADAVSAMEKLGFANDAQSTIRGMKHTKPGRGALWFGLDALQNGPIHHDGERIVIFLSKDDKNPVWNTVKWRNVQRKYIFPVWMKLSADAEWNYMGRYRLLPYTRRKENTVLQNGETKVRKLEKCLLRVDKTAPRACASVNMYADPKSWNLDELQQCDMPFPEEYNMPDEEPSDAASSSDSTLQFVDCTANGSGEDGPGEEQEEELVDATESEEQGEEIGTVVGAVALYDSERMEIDEPDGTNSRKRKAGTVSKKTQKQLDDALAKEKSKIFEAQASLQKRLVDAHAQYSRETQELKELLEKRQRRRDRDIRNAGVLKVRDRTTTREGAVVHYDTEQRVATADLLKLMVETIDKDGLLELRYKCVHENGNDHADSVKEKRITFQGATQAPDLYALRWDDFDGLRVVAECKADVKSTSVTTAFGQLSFYQLALGADASSQKTLLFVACYPEEPALGYQNMHANANQHVWWPGRGTDEPWINDLVAKLGQPADADDSEDYKSTD